MAPKKLPLRLMFLGDRRIAGEVLKLLHKVEFKNYFDLRVLVTGEELGAWCRTISATNLVVLRNDQRHAKRLESLIAEERIDILLSVQHNWILPQRILEAVKGRAFNLHNAKLPEYKGYNSISHALLNGEKRYHPTLHWMAEAVDSGPIAYEGDVPIASDDCAYSLYPKTVVEAVRIVCQLFDALKTGEGIPGKLMESRQGKFYKSSELSKLADVSAVKDPEELDRRVRALFFPPLNAAYIWANGRRHYLVPERALEGGWRTSAPINQISGQINAPD